MDSKLSFIMPVYIDKDDTSKIKFFSESLDSVINQTSENWSIIIVDDNSSNEDILDIIKEKFKNLEDKYIYYKKDNNCGPGIARNTGINIAKENGADIILFQDSDDLAHKKRVEITRKIFLTSQIDLLYSPFIPIDEEGREIPLEKLTPSIRDIIIANKTKKVTGKDVWKIISTETGYINLTSATSVKIKYALNVKFPGYRASEDAYTWMLYSAMGAVFEFTNEIQCKYRIPQNTSGSSSRSYIGKVNFYKELAKTNEEAFFKCIEIAQKQNSINDIEKAHLTTLFYEKLNQMLKDEGVL